MFAFNIILMGFILSLFFSNPNTANEIFKMFNFVCNASSIFLNLYHKPIVGKFFMFLPHFPYWCFVFDTSHADINNLKRLLTGGLGDDPNPDPNPNIQNDDLSIYTTIFFLLGQMLIYPLIFLYLKNVIRNEKDSKKGWLFFIKNMCNRTSPPNDSELISSSAQSLDIKNLVQRKANRESKCK